MRRCLVAAMLAMLLANEVVWAHDSGFGLARYAANGTLDQSFGNAGVVVIRAAMRSLVANALTLQPDGKILIGGMSSDLSSASVQLALARYNSDGTPDLSFGDRGFVTTPVGATGARANAIALQPDGKVVVAGTAFAHDGGDDEFFVARYAASGKLDDAFGSGGITNTHAGLSASEAAAVVLAEDGSIIVVGTAFSNGTPDDDFAVARYTYSGHLDPGFGHGGIVTTDFSSDPANPSLDRAAAVATQPDGRILVAGFTRGDHPSFAIVRYLSDGAPDTSFGHDGRTQVSTDGPLVNSVVLQNSGDIVIAGSSSSASTNSAPFTLVRLHSNGQPDASFGDGGLVTTTVQGSRSGARAVAAQADGKLITGGAKFGAPSAQGDALPDSGFALTRYNLDGTVDRGFGSGGTVLTDMGDAGATPLSLAVQPDGKILAAGLVFFQVPSTSASPISEVLRFAPLVAGVAVVVALLVVSRLTRRVK